MALKDIQKPRRILTLYHGSPITDIEQFDVTKSRNSFLDFGKGIYTQKIGMKYFLLNPDSLEY